MWWWWWRDFLVLNNAYKYFCYLRWPEQDRHKVTIYLVFNNDWTILKEPSHFFKMWCVISYRLLGVICINIKIHSPVKLKTGTLINPVFFRFWNYKIKKKFDKY